MSIRRALSVVLAIAVLLALALGVATGVGLWTSDAIVKRVQGANGQLEALHDLDGAVGRYGREVMNQLLFGYDRAGTLQTARNDMQRILNALARATREEFNVVSGSAELQGQLPELERVRRITDLFFTIDSAAGQSFMLTERGDRDAALELVARKVNFPLANEMQPLIDHAISEERKEIAAKTDELGALRERIAWTGVALAVLALLGLIAAAMLAARQLRRQIDGLVARARAALSGEGVAETIPPNRDFAPLALAVDEAAAAVRAEREKSAGADAQLQILDTERSHFLADIGHQLRTPLTILRGEADVALRGDTSEASLRESMERVRAQSAELGLLLEDMLEAARQEAEAAPAPMAQVELTEVVASAAGEGKVLAEPREVDIVVERTAGCIVVPGDFRRLKQALMIGIDNAVKHSPPGSTIRIGAARQEHRVTVQISDEGPGVAEEDQPHLFRRFYRGRQENDMLNTGFGIGLSIARRIIEQHGGTVALRNRSEGGALFEIALPCSEGASR